MTPNARGVYSVEEYVSAAVDQVALSLQSQDRRERRKHTERALTYLEWAQEKLETTEK